MGKPLRKRHRKELKGYIPDGDHEFYLNDYCDLLLHKKSEKWRNDFPILCENGVIAFRQIIKNSAVVSRSFKWMFSKVSASEYFADVKKKDNIKYIWEIVEPVFSLENLKQSFEQSKINGESEDYETIKKILADNIENKCDLKESIACEYPLGRLLETIICQETNCEEQLYEFTRLCKTNDDRNKNRSSPCVNANIKKYWQINEILNKINSKNDRELSKALDDIKIILK